MTSITDHAWLERAARLAVRGHGGAEPNPLVGCIIVDDEGRAVGSGHHARFGGPHAEVVALRAAGTQAAGATAYVTLEPCAHHGKTPPCAEALVAAGVGRVVIGSADPNAVAAGGASALADAGIEVTVHEHATCRAVLAPFVHRIRTGLPWVCAKWAQTIDGRIATREGDSRWISSKESRRLVHRERGRVDAILTGIGTVRADDPQLSARGVRTRRVARRVVVDRNLDTPPSAALVQTARVIPTTVFCADDAASDRAERLRRAGVEVLELPADARGHLPLRDVLGTLSDRHQAAHVLVEAGAGLTGALLADDLVDEAWVFTAPLLLADAQAMPCASGRVAPRLADAIAFETIGVHRRGPDVLTRLRVRRHA